MSVDLDRITCSGRSQAQHNCNRAPPRCPLLKRRPRECDSGAGGVAARTRQAVTLITLEHVQSILE